MSQDQNVNVIVSDSQDWRAPGSFQWLRPLATNAWADKAFAETELSSWSSKSQNLRDCPWFIRDLPKYRVRQKQWPSSPCVAHPRYRVIGSSRYLTNPSSHFHLLNVNIISTFRTSLLFSSQEAGRRSSTLEVGDWRKTQDFGGAPVRFGQGTP